MSPAATAMMRSCQNRVMRTSEADDHHDGEQDINQVLAYIHAFR